MVCDEGKTKPAVSQLLRIVMEPKLRCMLAVVVSPLMLIGIGGVHGEVSTTRSESFRVASDMHTLSLRRSSRDAPSLERISTVASSDTPEARSAPKERPETESAPPPTDDARNDGNQETDLPQSRMLVKNGRVMLRCERSRRSVQAVVAAVNRVVQKYNGYVEQTSQNTLRVGCYHTYCGSAQRADDEASHNKNVTTDEKEEAKERQRLLDGEQLEVSMRIRIPVDRFESLYEACKNIERSSVTSEGYDVEDITARYVDAAARVSALQATHDQLLAIMKRADAVSDVLKVQTQLGKVNQELESYKQQTRWFRQESSMSKLFLTIKESEPSFEGQRSAKHVSRPWKAFEQGVAFWKETFALLVDGSVYVCIFGFPLVCIGGCLIALGKMLEKPIGALGRQCTD